MIQRRSGGLPWPPTLWALFVAPLLTLGPSLGAAGAR